MRYGLTGLLLLVCLNAPAQSRPYGTKNYVRLTVENDLLQLRENDARDQNFTNGIHLDLMNHRGSPINFLLLEFPKVDGKRFDNLYVYSLGQEMYTPRCLTATAVQTNDRPYAGWLYLSSGLITTDVEKGLKLTSSLSIGVLGPASLSDRTQKAVHDFFDYTPINGWHNQVVNAPGLSYAVRYEFRPVRHLHRSFDLITLVEGHVGTITNYLGAGVLLRMGAFNNYFQNATGLYDSKAYVDTVANERLYSRQEEAQARRINRLESVGDVEKADKIRKQQKDQQTEGRSNRRFQAYTFIRPVARVALDNSFLQGGWLSGRRNPYTIQAEDLTRIYATVEYGGVVAGTVCGYTFQVCYTQSFRTKEFRTGTVQQWGKISLLGGF